MTWSSVDIVAFSRRLTPMSPECSGQALQPCEGRLWNDGLNEGSRQLLEYAPGPRSAQAAVTQPGEASSAGLDRAVRRRLRHGVRERGRRVADAGGPQGPAGEVWPVAPRGQDDASDRVRPLAGLGSTTTRRVSSGDLAAWLHHLLRVDPRWQIDVDGGVKPVKPVHDGGEDRRRLR
jgi:hypothetical protein